MQHSCLDCIDDIIMQEDVSRCRDCISVNRGDDGVLTVHWRCIRECVVWRRRVAVVGVSLANMQYSAVSCPPAVRATASTALLGGLGHRLQSAPLSAARLTDREGRVRSNLYCGTVAKQQRR